MSDPLSMSLDQIIEKNNSSRTKEGRKGRGGGGGRGNKVVRSVRMNEKKQFSDRPKTARTSFLSRDTDDDFGANSRPGSAPKLIYRSIKAGSSAQKQIIQPTSTVATVATSSVATKSVSSSVFSRLGKQPSSGSKVVFSSLVSSVEPADMEELCKTVGEIKDIVIKASWSGQKSAEVIFARRSDAVNCVAKFNGLTLDGVNMVVELAEEAAAPAPGPAAPRTIFDRITPGAVVPAAATAKPAAKAVRNNKEGLFGTAMQDDDDDDQQMQEEAHSTSFSVTFGGNGGRAGQLKQAATASSGGRSSFGHRSVTANSAAPRGGGRGGSRGGGRGKPGRTSSSESGGGKPKGREVGLNLDDDLDAYMKKR
eukprot:gene33810-43688_t